MIPLGGSTLGFRFDPLDVALTELHDAGFTAVDLAMLPAYCPHFHPVNATAADRERLSGQLRHLNLTVATLNVGDGLLGRPGDRQRVLDYTVASLDLARELGAYGVTIQSGVEPALGEWLAVAMSIAPDIRHLGDEARERGLELTLELHKVMLMATGQQALDLMELVDHPSVGVALDPSHATFAGEDVAALALQLSDYVKHVHLRDGIGQNIMVVPGDGTVDFTALARALQTIGYSRTATIELEYDDARADAVRGDLVRAKKHVEAAFAAA